MSMTETIEQAIRAGETVEPGALAAAVEADRTAALAAEGAADRVRDSRAAERAAEIDRIFDEVAAADVDPRLVELEAMLPALLAELAERAGTRSNTINDATNRLIGLDAVGGSGQPATAWRGCLVDQRIPRAAVNYLTSSPVERVLGVLVAGLGQDIRVGIRGSF